MNPLDLRSIAVVLVAVLLAGSSVWAASPDESNTRALVTVRIYDSFGVPVDDLTAARTAADAILRAAGVEPVWLHCPVLEAQRRTSRARCNVELPPGELVVRILRSYLPDTASGVPLGEAFGDRQTHRGSFATVFADRVASTAERAVSNPRDVLGWVIAHEIGHLLLGTNYHARQGLMRGVWTDQELRRPVGLEWRFSKSEARRIQARAVERADRAGM